MDDGDGHREEGEQVVADDVVGEATFTGGDKIEMSKHHFKLSQNLRTSLRTPMMQELPWKRGGKLITKFQNSHQKYRNGILPVGALRRPPVANSKERRLIVNRLKVLPHEAQFIVLVQYCKTKQTKKKAH